MRTTGVVAPAPGQAINSQARPAPGERRATWQRLRVLFRGDKLGSDSRYAVTFSSPAGGNRRAHCVLGHVSGGLRIRGIRVRGRELDHPFDFSAERSPGKTQLARKIARSHKSFDSRFHILRRGASYGSGNDFRFILLNPASLENDLSIEIDRAREFGFLVHIHSIITNAPRFAVRVSN
jgi:hypothetical protein